MFVGIAAFAEELSPLREYEPVVVRGAALTDWLNSDSSPSTRINLYRYEGNGVFAPVPFQVDKRRKINLRYNLNDPLFPLIGKSDVCEWGYFREEAPPPGSSDPFASDQIQPNDEIVFMMADAGELLAPVTVWPPGDVSNIRYVISITDSRTGVRRYVHVHLWNSAPPDLSATDYVTYTPDPNPPPGTCLPTNDACGRVTATAAGPFAALNGIDVHFQKNWVWDEVRVREDGGAALDDVLQRVQMSVPGETEDMWSSQGRPRFLDVKDGQIRVVRGVQGAMSGAHTTKYEFVYGTRADMVVNLRVHPLASLLVVNNHEQGVASDLSQFQREAYVHREAGLQVPAFEDQVNGAYSGANTFAGEAFAHWTDLATERRGSYTLFFRESRPVQATVRAWRYDENLGQQIFGRFGRRWEELANTQDGYLYANDGSLLCDPDLSGPGGDPCVPLGNDGGCPGTANPDASNYGFGRFDYSLIPAGSLDDASEEETTQGGIFAANLRAPLLPFATRHQRNVVPLPRPVPCNPGLALTPVTTGAVNLTIQNPCNGAFLGYLLYRAEGDGELAFHRDLGSATTYTDGLVVAGSTYRYAVRAYNDFGELGSLSQAYAVLVVDTTPPQKPGAIVISPLPSGAKVEWGVRPEKDTYGFNIYLSTSPGGPYTKLTAQARGAYEPREYSVSVVQPGTYYIVMTTLDYSGNESAYSEEASFTWSP